MKRIRLRLPESNTLYVISICYITFFFPLIALLNQATNQGTNIISLLYRSSTFIISAIIILREIFSNKKTLMGMSMILLIVFWIYYLLKLSYDLLILDLIQNPLLSANYYLSQTIGISFINMIAFYIAGKKIDFNILTRFLFIQVIVINIFIIFNFISNYGFDLSAYVSMRVAIYSEQQDIEYLNSITIGAYSAFLLIFIIYQKKIKLYHILLIIVAIFNLLVSASKGPLIALLSVILLITILKARKINLRFIVVSTIILSVIIVIFNAGILNDFNLFQRLVNPEEDASNLERISYISNALRQMEENLVFGTHYFVIADGSSPHNIFVDIILSTGIFGLLLFIYPLISFLKIIFINCLRHPIFSIAFFIFCMAQFSGYVYGLLEFWPVMGLILAFPYNSNNLLDTYKLKYSQNISLSSYSA